MPQQSAKATASTSSASNVLVVAGSSRPCLQMAMDGVAIRTARATDALHVAALTKLPSRCR